MKESNLKLKKAEADRDAMKAQSENLQEEYERVTARLREYEVYLAFIFFFGFIKFNFEQLCCLEIIKVSAK